MFEPSGSVRGGPTEVASILSWLAIAFEQTRLVTVHQRDHYLHTTDNFTPKFITRDQP